MGFLYFDLGHAIAVQDNIIQKSGGYRGLLYIDQLASVLEHIKNDHYYPKIEHKLTYLLYCINKGYSFRDGNKRSSIALSAYFLEINECGFKISRFIIEMENIAVYVAESVINKDLLFEIIYSLIYEDSYSEALKLKILNAIESH